jgi:hypothetical protein
MGKIYEIKTGQRRRVGRTEFIGMLETAEKYIGQLNFKNSNEAIDIITTMKWNGMFSPKFRDANTEPLEELLDDLYLKLNEEGDGA